MSKTKERQLWKLWWSKVLFFKLLIWWRNVTFDAHSVHGFVSRTVEQLCKMKIAEQGPSNSFDICKVVRWRPCPLPQQGGLTSHWFFLLLYGSLLRILLISLHHYGNGPFAGIHRILVIYHFLCNIHRIGGSSEMTLLSQASKERRHFSTSRTTGTMIGSFAIHLCIEKKRKETKNVANVFWCHNLCQICCPIAEICWWILLLVCWPMILWSKRNSKIIKGSLLSVGRLSKLNLKFLSHTILWCMHCFNRRCPKCWAQGQQRQCAQKRCQVYAQTIVSSCCHHHYFWQSHPCWSPLSMCNGHHIFSGYHNSRHNIIVSIGCHWCEPHTDHAAHPLLAYNDEQHTCDKDNTICSIAGTSQSVNKHHIVVVKICHECRQLWMALPKQWGCLFDFLTNDATLSNHQGHYQNPHNHSQQNRQKQQIKHWDTLPLSKRQVSCGSNHAPHDASKEMAVCNLFMQHPYSHEMATAHWGTYKKYIINNSNSVHVYNLRKQSGTRFKCQSAIPWTEVETCKHWLTLGTYVQKLVHTKLRNKKHKQYNHSIHNAGNSEQLPTRARP